MSSAPALILAAGGILSRETSSGDLILVIHRKAHKDWSLPKGKVSGQESLQETALREVHEETGCVAVLGQYLGHIGYDVGPKHKVVFFWRMRVLSEGPLPDNDEVDQVEWVTPAAAYERLTHALERSLIARLYPSQVRVQHSESS